MHEHATRRKPRHALPQEEVKPEPRVDSEAPTFVPSTCEAVPEDGQHWIALARTAPMTRPNGERNFGGQGGTCHHCRRSSGASRGAMLTSSSCQCARRGKKKSYWHANCLRFYPDQLLSAECPCCLGVCSCSGGTVVCATALRSTGDKKRRTTCGGSRQRVVTTPELSPQQAGPRGAAAGVRRLSKAHAEQDDHFLQPDAGTLEDAVAVLIGLTPPSSQRAAVGS